MADNPHIAGFRPYRPKSGAQTLSPLTGLIASGYQGAISGGTSIDISVGDPVGKLATGYMEIRDGFEAAGTGETVWGIVTDIKPFYNSVLGAMDFGNRLPGGTAYGTNFARQSKIGYLPVAEYYWEIDCDDAVTATTYAAYLALIGTACDHVLTTGSEPKSNVMLDISTTSTSDGQWKIVGISDTVMNQDFSGNYVKLIVEINEPQTALI